jgi:hypothetical protein
LVKVKPCASNIATGTHRSTRRSGSTPVNEASATPTISNARSPSVTALPTTDGSPPNLRCQNPWLMTATGCAPAVVSSEAESKRPSAGCTPSTRNVFPETKRTRTASSGADANVAWRFTSALVANSSTSRLAASRKREKSG